MTVEESLGDLLGHRVVEAGATELVPLSLSPLQARNYAGPDHAPLELGEDATHLKHGPASRGGRVQGLLMQVEVDACRLDFTEKANKVLKAATQAVHGPRSDEIELPSRRSLQEGVELGTLVAALRSADALILEDLYDFPARPFSNTLKVSKLVGDGLGVSGYSEVECKSLHAMRLPGGC